MKAKNILMTLLLAVGAIAAKASGFPPELALVSQPVMVYNYNSVTVYYDVENIGDYTYRGNICIYLDPDDGFSYAEKYVKVRAGRIKRIAVEIPSYSIDRHIAYTIMPYYTVGRELYSFTTFEYFEPIRFCWHGTRTEPWVVIHIGPRVRYYHRPGTYRYYYDGFRPPMPPHGHAMHPMDPMHHTYGYHYNNGGYPATHNWNSDEPKPNSGSSASGSSATVRPNNSGASSGSTSGSMSSGNANTGNNSGTTGSVSNGSSKPTNPAAPRNDSGSVSRPSNSRPSSGTSSSGRTGNSGSSRVNNNSNSSRPSSGTSNSGRTGNSNVNRSSSSNSRSSGTTNSGSSRASSSSSNTRSSGTSSSTSRSSSSSSNSSSRSGAGTRGR